MSVKLCRKNIVIWPHWGQEFSQHARKEGLRKYPYLREQV